MSISENEKDYFNAVEALNYELHETQEDCNQCHLIAFTSSGAYTFITFNDHLLWSSEDNEMSEELREMENQNEAMDTFLRQELRKYVQQMNKLIF